MTQMPPYSLRVDKKLMEKFKVVAAKDGRSVNKEIGMLIERAVQEFEKKNGPIPVPEWLEND